ncbi:hypothetical protein JL720_1102 [Aureococcus anophagefferens]|nr:hypothetical protein JL720_1102 [Aureococcus anophagefferens]
MPCAAFANAKEQALTKCDKSSAGRIDPRAVSVCGAVNDSAWLFTLSSCSGRCYLWRGEGVKATAAFSRGRVSHDRRRALLARREEHASFAAAPLGAERTDGGALWLRFEPFILHVRCADAAAANALMRSARTVFKNVGLQSANFTADGVCVAIVGDEGLDMPLRDEDGQSLFRDRHADWLAALVNDKHDRNWAKIARFEADLRAALAAFEAAREDDDDGAPSAGGKLRYDAVGDAACLRRPLAARTARPRRALASNAKLRVVVAPAAGQTLASGGAACAPSEPFAILGGGRRSPLTLRRSKGDRVADKLEIVTDDALLELRRRADSGETFDRVTCPRPKGRRDGDRVDGDADDADDGGDGGGGPDGALFAGAAAAAGAGRPRD